jgi:hypothetical protein
MGEHLLHNDPAGAYPNNVFFNHQRAVPEGDWLVNEGSRSCNVGPYSLVRPNRELSMT